MSRTYAEVIQEIKSLQAEADSIKQAEVAEVIEKIKHAIEVYGLTSADLGLAPARKGAKPGPKPGSKRGRKPGKPAARKARAAAGIKYRDGANTWVGRGKRPQWLRDALAAGKSLKDFAV